MAQQLFFFYFFLNNNIIITSNKIMWGITIDIDRLTYIFRLELNFSQELA